MNYVNELELQPWIEDIVYVIYTSEGAYATLPTYEDAEYVAEVDGLIKYTIKPEKICIYN